MPNPAVSRASQRFLFIARCALAGLLVLGSAQAGSLPAVALHRGNKHELGKLTFIDPDTLAVLGVAHVENFPLPLSFDASGAVLHVFSARPPIMTAASAKKPWVLSIVDTGAFTTTRVGELGRPPFRYFTDDPSTRLYVFKTVPKAKTSPIVAFDLVARKRIGPIANVERLQGAALSPDGALLYVLCQGKKHKKPKGPPGNLHVLDATTGAEVARHDVGSEASSVAFDSKRALAYVLGVAGNEGRGPVTVLRGATIVARFTLPSRALGLAFGPDDVAYVLAKGAVVALAADGFAAAHSWRVQFDPADLVFDTANRRMFAAPLAGSRVAELDLETGEVLAEHPTGRSGTKVGKGAGLALVALFVLGATALTGVPVGPPGIWATGSLSMALRSDGAFLYVLNPFTNDVMLFDTAKRDVVGYVPTGGGSFRMVRVRDDPNLWIESRGSLMRLDTSTQRIDRTIDLTEGLSRAAVAYDRSRGRAWVLTKTTIRLVDLRTGEIAGTVELDSPAFGVGIDDSRIVPSSAW